MEEAALDHPTLNPKPRGRGAISNRSGRFEATERELIDDGWNSLAGDEANDLAAEIGTQLETIIGVDNSRSIISKNDSPDIGFDRSINPYKGCEHGCIYCYARPTHTFLGLSAGVDFERRIFAKPHAAELLREAFNKPRYEPQTIVIGANTDCYQPVERQQGITRQVLEVMLEAKHPVGLITKSDLITRDIDLLAELAKDDLVHVGISVTSLDPKLSRLMEPRASSPAKRLAAIKALSEAGIPVRIMTAPMIPAVNDDQLEKLLTAGREMGARYASYTMLRVPLEIEALFREWLDEHFPDRAKRVFSLLRGSHNIPDQPDRAYNSEFGTRMRGSGPYADLLRQRFRATVMRLGLNSDRPPLPVNLFRSPAVETDQFSMGF
ncbi:MAG: PA0069 family radical SAM protein [Pseudomonadota bacterium]